jgi:ketopantoate reductase
MDSILIVGTGALACLFAARLAAQGVQVTMLGTWREGLAALRMYGVTIVQEDGKQTSYPVRVVDQTDTCIGSKYALVLVKSWQTQRAARQMADCLDSDGVALTLQNGLGNYETLSEELGEDRVALGVTTTGATLLSSGRVRPGGEGTVSLGPHPRLDPIIDLLRLGGFNLEIHQDLRPGSFPPIWRVKSPRWPQPKTSNSLISIQFKYPKELPSGQPPTIPRCTRTFYAVRLPKSMRFVVQLSRWVPDWEYRPRSTTPCGS